MQSITTYLFEMLPQLSDRYLMLPAKCTCLIRQDHLLILPFNKDQTKSCCISGCWLRYTALLPFNEVSTHLCLSKIIKSLRGTLYLIIVIVMKLPLKRWVWAICTFLIGKVILEFNLHAVLVDIVRSTAEDNQCWQRYRHLSPLLSIIITASGMKLLLLDFKIAGL